MRCISCLKVWPIENDLKISTILQWNNNNNNCIIKICWKVLKQYDDLFKVINWLQQWYKAVNQQKWHKDLTQLGLFLHKRSKYHAHTHTHRVLSRVCDLWTAKINHNYRLSQAATYVAPHCGYDLKKERRTQMLHTLRLLLKQRGVCRWLQPQSQTNTRAGRKPKLNFKIKQETNKWSDNWMSL